MPISLSARVWRFIVSRIFKNQKLTIEQNRARSNMASRYTPNPRGISIERIEVEGLPTARIRPDAAKAKWIMLYLHGGGYVTGGIDSHLMLCIQLAQTLEMEILLPEYRLAPENPFPAALDDALAVYRWLLASGFRAERIFIAGDSAGGGLSLATTLALRDAGDSLPAGVICLSPWTVLTNDTPSHRINAKAEAMLDTPVLKEWAMHYAETDETLKNPLVSPAYAEYHHFPPLLIQVGGDEILLDDAHRVAEKAQSAGVDVTLRVWDEMWHVWQMFGNLLPESRAALDEIKDWINSRLVV